MLVPVGESVTLRNTVAYVVRKAAEAAGEGAEMPQVHFVFPVSWQYQDLNSGSVADAEELLERVQAWVYEDLDVHEDEELPISMTTNVIGGDEFLFSPQDYAEELLEYAEKHGLDHVVFDPEYKPGSRAPLLTPIAADLDLAESVTHEEAPVDRPITGRRLIPRAIDFETYVVTFVLSFLFYQVIGGFAGPLDYATGAISAGITAIVLTGVTFHRDIRGQRALGTTLRWFVYVPYLFWEIAKANLQVVYVVLHPSMPIDPSMEEFSPAVPQGLPVTTLANSITLTPGTVTVDVRGGKFHVHALTQAARDGIYDGGLERAVRFVFFGRSAARIASPRERGQAESDSTESQSQPIETPGQPTNRGTTADQGNHREDSSDRDSDPGEDSSDQDSDPGGEDS
jgi:multicomponent Na+:H+ antiporter subunit E